MSLPRRLLPVLVLVLGVAAAVTAATLLQRQQTHETERALDGAVREDVAATHAELQRSEDVLRALRGLFSASRRVTERDFRAFAARLELGDRSPALQALNFTARVPRARLAAFVARRRAEGTPSFAVEPVRRLAEHRPITYVEPIGPNAAALGFDTATRQASRPAQDASRDTARSALSGRLTLIQDAQRRPGFLLLLPVYAPGRPTGTREERRRALRGWATAAFRGPDFLRAVLAGRGRELDVALYDGARARPERLLAGDDLGPGEGVRDVVVRAADRPWTLRFRPGPGIAASGMRREPLLVLVGGLLLSGLLATLALVLRQGSTRALNLVEERTAELRRSQNALAVLNHELEAHSDEVELFAQRQRDFVATSSHELRTPLTAILGYLEMVLEEPDGGLPDDQRAHLQVAYRNGQRLLGLAEDLIAVNRIDTERLGLDLAPTALSGLLLPLEETFAPVSERKGVALTVRLPAARRPVSVDRVRIRQVLENLVGNALKFTPRGGRIRVACTVVEDDVRISVADTGMGIPAHELPHVFDRFYRSSLSQAMAVPGTGLGLAIAKALVEAQDGTLTVASELGVGTTFTLTLPLMKEHACPASSSSMTSRTSSV